MPAIPKMQMKKKDIAEDQILDGVMDRDAIMQMIPHRPPMLLIDEVREVILDKSAVGIKRVREDDHFFEGHFPSRPVMPGVMIIEAMAQTAAVLVVKTLGEEAEGSLVYFMSVDGAKFRKPVVPGNELRLHVKKKKNKRNVWKFAAEAYVDGTLVAQSMFSAMLLDEK